MVVTRTSKDVEKGNAKVCPIPRLGKPFYFHLRSAMTWWKEQGASKEVLDIISQGVACEWPCPRLQIRQRTYSKEDQLLAKKVLEKYLGVGAVKKLSWSQVKFLIPWFVIKKTEDSGKEKLRLISDCRDLNRFFDSPKFKLDRWEQISLS